MKRKPEPPAGSLEAAELFQLRMAIKSTYAQRLQDLQEMIDLNAEAEARNPRLRLLIICSNMATYEESNHHDHHHPIQPRL